MRLMLPVSILRVIASASIVTAATAKQEHQAGEGEDPDAKPKHAPGAMGFALPVGKKNNDAALTGLLEV
jgi:hypothetical protein